MANPYGYATTDSGLLHRQMVAESTKRVVAGACTACCHMARQLCRSLLAHLGFDLTLSAYSRKLGSPGIRKVSLELIDGLELFYKGLHNRSISWQMKNS